MSIRKRLIAILLGISLISIVLVSIVAYATVSRELTAKNVDNLQVAALRQKQRLNDILNNEHEQALQLSIKFDLKSAVQDYLATKNPQALATMHTLIIGAQTQEARVLAVSIANLDGTVLSSTNAQMTGKKIGDQPYFGADAAKESIQLLPAATGREEGVYLTAPVTVANKPQAILIMTFADDDIIAVAQDYNGLGRTGETVLAAVGNTDERVSLTPLRFDNSAGFKTDLRVFHLNSTADHVYMNLADYRGHRVMVATTYLDLVNWGLATKIDRDEAFKPINQLRTMLFLICVIAAIATIVVALYFANRLTAPIMALTRKTQLIMQGDIKQKIDITSSDEVGQLGTAFNQMTARLSELYEGLERKVAEKTAQLSDKVLALQQATAVIEKAKNAAEATSAKDEAILANMGEGVIVTDPNGKLVLMNPVAEELLEVEPGTYVGRLMAEVSKVTKEDGSPPAIEAEAALLGASHARSSTALMLTRKDGSKTAISLTTTSVLSGGQSIGIIGIIRDVTKEKEVDRMKTEFISLASHQLRTPLSAIKWFTEMLISGDAGKLSKDQSEFAQNISESTQRMIELVTSLLNISRMESGRIIIDPKPTDLKELVDGIVNDLKAKIEERQQHLAVSVYPDLPKINLDPHLIGQVFLNLLTNAIKYTPKGGEITVMVSRKGDDLLSQVTDNGYGIPQAEQAKMFQKFFRATNIVKVEADGTGLGMYLIKSIVESSGGKIWFESEEGKGTTFWFSLPMSGMKAKAGEVRIDG